MEEGDDLLSKRKRGGGDAPVTTREGHADGGASPPKRPRPEGAPGPESPPLPAIVERSSGSGTVWEVESLPDSAPSAYSSEGGSIEDRPRPRPRPSLSEFASQAVEEGEPEYSEEDIIVEADRCREDELEHARREDMDYACHEIGSDEYSNGASGNESFEFQLPSDATAFRSESLYGGYGLADGSGGVPMSYPLDPGAQLAPEPEPAPSPSRAVPAAPAEDPRAALIATLMGRVGGGGSDEEGESGGGACYGDDEDEDMEEEQADDGGEEDEYSDDDEAMGFNSELEVDDGSGDESGDGEEYEMPPPEDVLSSYTGNYDPFTGWSGTTLDLINARDRLAPLMYPRCPRGSSEGAGERYVRSVTIASNDDLGRIVEAVGVMSFESRLSNRFSEEEFTPLNSGLRARAAAWDAATIHPVDRFRGCAGSDYDDDDDDDYLGADNWGGERLNARAAVRNSNATALSAYQRLHIVARGSGQVSALELASGSDNAIRSIPIDIPRQVEEARSLIAEWDREPFDPTYCPFCTYASTYAPTQDNNASVNAFILAAAIAVTTTDVRIRCQNLAAQWNTDRQREDLSAAEMAKRMASPGHVYLHFYAHGACVKWAFVEIYHSISDVDNILDSLKRNVLTQTVRGQALYGPPRVDLRVSDAIVKYSAERVKMVTAATASAESTATLLLLNTAMAGRSGAATDLRKKRAIGMSRQSNILRSALLADLS